MVKLEGHKINPVNQLIELVRADEPGLGPDDVGGLYEVAWPGGCTAISFHRGVLGPDQGVCGITHEVLLEILIDRLENFQKGKFANEFNAAALQSLVSARNSLLYRTQERIERGVEGTHTV